MWHRLSCRPRQHKCPTLKLVRINIFLLFSFYCMHIKPENGCQNVVYLYNYIFSALQSSANKCCCLFMLFEIVVLRF